MVVQRDAEVRPLDLEIELIRVINAPRRQVLNALADSRHLSQWWGPEDPRPCRNEWSSAPEAWSGSACMSLAVAMTRT